MFGISQFAGCTFHINFTIIVMLIITENFRNIVDLGDKFI